MSERSLLQAAYDAKCDEAKRVYARAGELERELATLRARVAELERVRVTIDTPNDICDGVVTLTIAEAIERYGPESLGWTCEAEDAVRCRAGMMSDSFRRPYRVVADTSRDGLPAYLVVSSPESQSRVFANCYASEDTQDARHDARERAYWIADQLNVGGQG